MPTKKKKRLIVFPAPTEAWLVEEAKKLDVSVSEVVRRAIDEIREKK